MTGPAPRPWVLVASEVASNLAYVAGTVAVLAMLFPGFRWWLRGQLAQARYEVQIARWRQRHAPLAALLGALGRDDLPAEPPAAE